jgi:hypothetical protein
MQIGREDEATTTDLIVLLVPIPHGMSTCLE